MIDSLEVLAIGQQVTLTLDGNMAKPFPGQPTLGLIVAILIEQDAVRYRVAYWEQGRRRTALVTDIEISPHKLDRKVTNVRKKKVAS